MVRHTCLILGLLSTAACLPRAATCSGQCSCIATAHASVLCLQQDAWQQSACACVSLALRMLCRCSASAVACIPVSWTPATGRCLIYFCVTSLRMFAVQAPCQSLGSFQSYTTLMLEATSLQVCVFPCLLRSCYVLIWTSWQKHTSSMIHVETGLRSAQARFLNLLRSAAA